MDKIKVLDLNGNAVKQIDLPKIFSTPIRPDLWIRALIAIQQSRRQRYGTDPLAGERSSAHYHGYRRYRWTMMNREMARLPRIHGKVGYMSWRARKVPQAVKGRAAHPPFAIRDFSQKINDKERRKAISSAIAATCVADLVSKRHPSVGGNLPYVLTNDIEKIKKSSEAEQILSKLGFEKEIERCRDKRIRGTRGKRRGRRYRKKVGMLIVVSKDEGVSRAARNLPGVDVVRVSDLNIEALVPGGIPRLVLWSADAIEALRAPEQKRKIAVKA